MLRGVSARLGTLGWGIAGAGIGLAAALGWAWLSSASVPRGPVVGEDGDDFVQQQQQAARTMLMTHSGMSRALESVQQPDSGNGDADIISNWWQHFLHRDDALSAPGAGAPDNKGGFGMMDVKKMMGLAHDLEEHRVDGVDVARWLPPGKRQQALSELQPVVDAYGSVPTFLSLPTQWQVRFLLDGKPLRDGDPRNLPAWRELGEQAERKLKEQMQRQGGQDGKAGQSRPTPAPDVKDWNQRVRLEKTATGSNWSYAQPNLAPSLVVQQAWPGRTPKPVKMMIIDTSIQPNLKPGFMTNIHWHVLPGPGLEAQRSCLAWVSPWVQAHGSRMAWIASAAFWRTWPQGRLDVYNLPFTGGCEEVQQFQHFLDALDLALEMDMDIVNISLALNERFFHQICPRPLQERIDRLGQRGVLIVAAAGNLPAGELYPPASCSGVLVVGNDRLRSSTGGENRDNFLYTQSYIETPAWRWQRTLDVMPAGKGNNWEAFPGTSASASLASGVLSTWLALQPAQCKPTWKALHAHVRAASRRLDKPSPQRWQGGLSLLTDRTFNHYPAARQSGDVGNVRVLDGWMLLGLAPAEDVAPTPTLWPQGEDCAAPLATNRQESP